MTNFVTPTPGQIAQVKTNLENIQALNDYIYNKGALPLLQNAYWLLSEPSPADLGAGVAMNLLGGAYWALGSEFGAIGSFLAAFITGMMSDWASDPPSSLNHTFASMEIRLSNTSQALDAQLATFHEDVVGNWNVTYSFNGQSQPLSALANVTVPPESHPDFEKLAKVAIFALDQQIWQKALQDNFVLWSMPQMGNMAPGTQDQPPIQFIQSLYAQSPFWYSTWTWHVSTGGCDPTGWSVDSWYIGPVNSPDFAPLDNDACAYLFQDSTPGTTINPDGLFTRQQLFNDLGIPTANHPPAGGGPSLATAKLSLAYLRAMKMGKTLGILIQREGRAEVERRVIEKAHQDPVFALNLTLLPRTTLEQFLDIKIPDVVSVNVVVENPLTFGLVIPIPGNTNKS